MRFFYDSARVLGLTYVESGMGLALIEERFYYYSYE